MVNIMEQSLVNYDFLQERVSTLLNKRLELQYLVFTLMIRAYSSGYEGFSNYFLNECEHIEIDNHWMTKQIVDNNKAVDFKDIQGIPLRGNKLVDLLSLYIDGLNKVQTVEKEMMEFVASKVEFRIVMQNVMRTTMTHTQVMLSRAEKLKKRLDKAINNYEVTLLIDYKLGENYK